MYLFLELFDYLSLLLILFLYLCKSLFIDFEILLKLLDKILLSFPVLFHHGHLLLHLDLVALKLHISHLCTIELSCKPLSVIHQNLSDAKNFLKVLL